MLDFSWRTVGMFALLFEVVSRAFAYLTAMALAADTTLDNVPVAKRDAYERKLTLLGPSYAVSALVAAFTGWRGLHQFMVFLQATDEQRMMGIAACDGTSAAICDAADGVSLSSESRKGATRARRARSPPAPPHLADPGTAFA